jgi:hypothetical protein
MVMGRRIGLRLGKGGFIWLIDLVVDGLLLKSWTAWY